MAEFYNIGHRGAAAYQHENTIVSLEEAVKRGADMVEFDLRKTADDVIVLFHDTAVKTLSGEQKAISKISMEELAGIARTEGFEIALFEDVLKLFGSRICLNIEIKAGGIESNVVSMLHTYPPLFEPTLSSFFPWVVLQIRKIDPGLKTGLILGQDGVNRVNILTLPVVRKLISTLGIRALHLQDSIVNAELILNLKRSGLSAIVWTVDKREDMYRFIKMGVDGIITNKPDLLYEVCIDFVDAEGPMLVRSTDKLSKFIYAA